MVDDEYILYRGGFNWLWYAGPWIALAVPAAVYLGGHAVFAADASLALLITDIVAGALLVLGVLIALEDVIRLTTVSFGITNRRVLVRKGLFRTRLEDIALADIESSRANKCTWGRLFNFGAVTVNGRSGKDIRFPTMRAPKVFRQEVEKARTLAAEQAKIDPAVKAATEDMKSKASNDSAPLSQTA